MEVNTAPPAHQDDKIAEGKDELALAFEEQGQLKPCEVHDAFGNEEYAEIKYKTLKWWYVSIQRSSMRCIKKEVLTRHLLGNVVYS